MESEVAAEEAEEAAGIEEVEHTEMQSPAPQKIIGFIVAAILIFLAQRDLRKRSPELVRGPVVLWKALAMVPPGAVAYLVFGRRRAAKQVTIEMSESIAA